VCCTCTYRNPSGEREVFWLGPAVLLGIVQAIFSTIYNEVDDIVDLSERVVSQGQTTPNDSKEVSMDYIQRDPNPHVLDCDETRIIGFEVLLVKKEPV